MRATNHHGRGTAKHASRHGYTAPHIDKARSKDNRFWTWCGGVRETDADGACPGLEGDERLYYSSMFRKGIEAQNEIYRKRRQYGKVRTPDDFYARRVTQPEESLLYIGDKSFRGAVSPDVLWDCVREYVAWEREFSRAHGDFYVPLSLSLHADERGQWHVHERGVYQYADGAGNLRIGQAAALEAAGFPLPDPDADRSVDNNRKMTWDAARREKCGRRRWRARRGAGGRGRRGGPPGPRPRPWPGGPLSRFRRPRKPVGRPRPNGRPSGPSRPPRGP